MVIMSIHKNKATLSRSQALSDKPSVEPNQGEKRRDEWSDHLHRLGHDRSESAFVALFEHFAPQLKRFYATNLGHYDDHILEELVQDVMYKVWTKAPSFDRSKAAASTWIYTIARNTRIDFIRKNGSKDANTVELVAEDIWDEELDNQPYIYLNQSRNKSTVDQLLAELPPEQSTCLKKIYMEGKSHVEVADELALPLGTVKSRIRLGVKKLQASLTQPERVA